MQRWGNKNRRKQKKRYIKFYQNLFEKAEIESDVSKGIIQLKLVNIKEKAKLKENNENKITKIEIQENRKIAIPKIIKV